VLHQIPKHKNRHHEENVTKGIEELLMKVGKDADGREIDWDSLIHGPLTVQTTEEYHPRLILEVCPYPFKAPPLVQVELKEVEDKCEETEDADCLCGSFGLK
jgi:hypothetical protein